MFDSMKKDKVKMITLLGMAVMIIAVAVKAATSSVIAAAAIHIAGLACFFIIEGIEKTPDSESGLSFKRFFSDLKKPGVLLLILFLLVLSPVEMLLSKAVFGSAYIDHVLGRVNVPGLLRGQGDEALFILAGGCGRRRALCRGALYRRRGGDRCVGPGRNLYRRDPFCDPVPQDRQLPDQLYSAFSQ